MDTKKYAVFVKTVELSSLTKAAEELGLTQSGVSHIIAALESDLGLTLLRRTRTGAHLTADGERLLPIIREIVRQDERLHREAAELTDLVAGPIRLGTFTSVATHWLPAMMMQFEQEHPQVEFRLFNGTTHAGRIKAYVQFCLAMSAWAINCDHDNLHFKSVAGYTQQQKHDLMLRVLTKRLGMRGPEFKTARLHLTSAFLTEAESENTAA